MSVNKKMTAIADNIRSKTGGIEALSLDDMASGVNDVYEAGKKSFWDNYLSRMRQGLEVVNLFAGTSWNSDTFYPTEDLIIKDRSNYIFQYFSWWRSPYIDLAQRLEECRVVLDTSQCTGFTFSFSNCFVTRLPKIDVRSGIALDRTFMGSVVLKTIDELVLRDDGLNTFNNTFQNCSALQNITISGSIQNSINFSACPLSVASLKSIISCMNDFSGTTSEYTYTVTFKTSAFNVLEAEGATAEYNGLACTWAELIDNKKWNLVKG